jgi:pyruvate formate lyase activating enzyme
VSRFHPQYKMTDRPPTPVASIQKARRIGLAAGLRYVYAGNVPGDEGEHTFCRACHALLVERWGFQVRSNRIRDNRCPDCETVVEGVW